MPTTQAHRVMKARRLIAEAYGLDAQSVRDRLLRVELLGEAVAVARVRASLATVEDAHRLMEDCPAPDTPARSYFSNFAFFLSNLVPPGGANASELMLYADFIDRLVQAGQFAADRGAEVNEKLRSAIGSALLR